MTENTIAAVVPIYNKKPYVALAIRSILDQSRPVDEIILVDDGSTDGSQDQIRLFRDGRIRVIQHATPGGPSRARNHAIGAATSKWIAFLDADDMWHSHFIAEVHAMLSQTDDQTGCVFTGWHSVWSDGSVTQDRYSARFSTPTFTRLDFDRFLSYWLTVRACPIWTSAVAIRRDVLLHAGLFPDRCLQGEDKDTWLRVMSFTQAISSSRPSSSYHRFTNGQITRTCSMNVRHCLCPTLEQMISEASGPRRRLLKRLLNLEVYEYAMHVGQREHVLPEVYRGFSVSLDPGRYCVLLSLTYLPVPLQRVIRACIGWIAAGAGRPGAKWQAHGTLKPS